MQYLSIYTSFPFSNYITDKYILNENKKVLVVGGCGYIGGYTTDLLSLNNFDVTIYDNLLYEDRFLKNVNFINGDIKTPIFLYRQQKNLM